MLGPVELDAAFHRGRAEDEGAVDEVVQAGRDQDPLKEGVNPDAERAGDQHELLQGGDTHLHLGPAQQGQPGAGDHHEEGDYGDERAALEMPRKTGNCRSNSRLCRAVTMPEMAMAPMMLVSRVLMPATMASPLSPPTAWLKSTPK